MKEDRSYTLRLSEEDINDILVLLADDKYEWLNEEIARQMRNKALQNVLWFNVYYMNEVYGGPEEGGWWYTTTECVYSTSFAIHHDVDLRNKYNKRLLYAFFRKCAKDAMEDEIIIDKPSALYDVYVDKDTGGLVTNNYASYYKHDPDSNTHIKVCFEYAPGIQHNMERQHYC